MGKITRNFQKMDEIALVITFSVMVVASFIQVLNRNIFQIPVIGLEEISKYSMVYMVLLGTELGLRDGTQISIDSVVDSLKGNLRKTVKVISKMILIIFSALMFIESVKLVNQQITTQQISPGLQIPMSIPYAALVISFGLITIVQSAILIKYLKDEKSVKNVQDTEVQK